MHPMDVEAMPVASLGPYVQRTYPFQEADPADREQHRAICDRPPRALRFGPMIFGPK